MISRSARDWLTRFILPSDEVDLVPIQCGTPESPPIVYGHASPIETTIILSCRRFVGDILHWVLPPLTCPLTPSTGIRQPTLCPPRAACRAAADRQPDFAGGPYCFRVHARLKASQWRCALYQHFYTESIQSVIRARFFSFQISFAFVKIRSAKADGGLFPG